MEGISHEAGSLAGHLGLGKLTYLYDSNNVTLDGPASLAFSEDVGKRYEAYGWQVLRVEDGNTDLEAIDSALREAAGETAKPTLIIVRTTIGYGSPHKAGTSEAHGSPLGDEEVAATKKALGWEHEEPFYVPPDALEHFRSGGRAREGCAVGVAEPLRLVGPGESGPRGGVEQARRPEIFRRAGTPTCPGGSRERKRRRGRPRARH